MAEAAGWLAAEKDRDELAIETEKQDRYLDIVGDALGDLTRAAKVGMLSLKLAAFSSQPEVAYTRDTQPLSARQDQAGRLPRMSSVCCSQ